MPQGDDKARPQAMPNETHIVADIIIFQGEAQKHQHKRYEQYNAEVSAAELAKGEKNGFGNQESPQEP